MDTYVYVETYMAVLLKRVKKIRVAIARHGLNPDRAADAFEKYLSEMHPSGTSYDADTDSFSSPYKGSRTLTARARLIDLAINFAHRERSKITSLIHS